MPRLQSQIPRLKPASSCGNLVQLAAKSDLQRSHHGSRTNLHSHNNPSSERSSMINAPTPVTHRRMYSNHFASRPPWAIDETISPFDREPEVKKKNQIFNRPPVSERGTATQNLLQPVAIRVESPANSMDYLRDDLDGFQSPFDNVSYHRSNSQMVISPQKQVISCQTDLTGMDFNYTPLQNEKGFENFPSYSNKTEKKLILPLKELKRTNHKNNSTYKISNKGSTRDPIDINKVYNIQEVLPNKSEEDAQSRIDYWLNKNINQGNQISNKSSHSNVKENPISPESNKPIFRNQITFTPRPVSSSFSNSGRPQNLNRYSSNPQIIEAVIFQSDSESDRDYIVSSKSIENKLNRPNSHFTIRANLATKSKINSNEKANTVMCEICGLQLLQNEMISPDFNCHKNCFKCFWCKKKLNLDNYKLSIDRLCCPLHFRLSSN